MSNENLEYGNIPSHIPIDLVRNVDIFGQKSGDDPFISAAKTNRLGKVFFNIGDKSLENSGVWVVTDLVLMRRALKLPGLFSSNGTTNFSRMVGEDWDLIPIELDPPRHSHFRRILSAAFSPMRMKQLEPFVRESAVRLIEEFRGEDGCEFIEAFADPFPRSAFIHLLGLPQDQYETFCGWEKGKLHSLHSLNRLKRMAAARAIVEYMRDFIKYKRRNQGDDLVTLCINADIDGDRATDSEILGICVLMFIAGLDTVAASLGLNFRHLAMNPKMSQNELRLDPGKAGAAAIELLRRYSVINDRIRILTADSDILGVDMKAGDRVLFPTALVNLSEEAFVDPLTVEFGRDNREHAGFFYGAHRCLGRHLATLELTIAIQEWLDRIPEFRLANPTPPPISSTSGVFGVEKLYIEWGRA
jgi:cytochrome P450